MSDQVDDFRADKSLSAYVHRVTSAIGVQMSPTGRRAATSVAASRLRQWVNGTHEEWPTRGELKAWVLLILPVALERSDLHNRVEALTKENDALRARIVDAREEASTIYTEQVEAVRREQDPLQTLADSRRRKLDALERELDAVRAQRDEALEESETFRIGRDELQELYARVVEQRDEALEGYREDVERFRAHVQLLDEDRTRRTKERDTAERNLHERTVEMTKRYEELRTAYDQAEGERNHYARTLRQIAAVGRIFEEPPGAGVGRASCPHTSRGGAE